MIDLKMTRMGLVMEPEPGNDFEVEGTLNPAAVRGPDGHLYLFPRLVAKGNYSRIGIVRVKFNESGDPLGVERLGIALEPNAPYELRTGGGGCEDPRVTYVEPLKRYIMSYTGLSNEGPRIALAESHDLMNWTRLGLANFSHTFKVDLDHVDNKDSCVFPLEIVSPHGRKALALLQRPIFPGQRPEDLANHRRPHAINMDKESIWICYAVMVNDLAQPYHLREFTANHLLAVPEQPWEHLKVGVGPPPVLTPHGWLMIYHGVGDSDHVSPNGRKMRYSAGMMILAKEDPRTILYRSPEPILMPETPYEVEGMVADVVFPTGIDQRNDLGMPNRFDVYYGMADSRIGVARLDLPEDLSSLG